MAKRFVCRLTSRCAAAFLVAALCSVALAGKDDGKLDFYFIDVEGGAATLIDGSPEGEHGRLRSGLECIVEIENRYACTARRIGAAVDVDGVTRLERQLIVGELQGPAWRFASSSAVRLVLSRGHRPAAKVTIVEERIVVDEVLGRHRARGYEDDRDRSPSPGSSLPSTSPPAAVH